jgi:DNA-directed RNA polymerase subunit alpha
MAILNFVKPDKVIMINSSETSGQFEFRPLEPGFGITIGNSLRRILLSSLEGYAVTSLRIEGVDHEFSTIKGVVEDVTEIVLNLKQVRFKKQLDNHDNEKITVHFAGSDKFTAGDIGKYVNGFQILNPDLVIFNCDPSVRLKMELTVERGRGYVPAEENKTNSAPNGTIFIDSIYTPIKNVKYNIENYRVEQKTDYERLILDIVTDGSIHPKDALDAEEKRNEEEFDETSLHMRQLLKTKLVDMDLSVRALNCLKAADVETLGELVSFNKNDLLKFRNFGKKSLTELEDLVQTKGLQFGMNVVKYKLDKD